MPSRYRMLAGLLLVLSCGDAVETESPDAQFGDVAQPSQAHDAGLDAAPAAATDAASDAVVDATSVVVPDAGVDATAPGDATLNADASTSPDGGSGAGSGLDASAPDAGNGAGHAPCPATGPCKILPLGDSITYGLGYSGGYRVELFRKARADMKQITFVGSVQNGPSMVDGATFPRRNEGHSGWTIEQIAGLVPDPALDDPPHIVLLMAGTNDINLRRDLPNAPKRLGALIDELVSELPEALIVVAQITPLSRTTSALDEFNAALPAVVAARASAGKHVLLVDMNSQFPEGGLGDGVHPNQKGYEWMAGVWYGAMSGSLR